jgi:hypothetical protein
MDSKRIPRGLQTDSKPFSISSSIATPRHASSTPLLQVTFGLWLLVVETLIFNIISQRARPMMTKNSEERP